MLEYSGTSDPAYAKSSALAKRSIEALAGSVVSQTPLTVQQPSSFGTMLRSSASCAGPICPNTIGPLTPRSALWTCMIVTSSAVVSVWGSMPRTGPKSTPLTVYS